MTAPKSVDLTRIAESQAASGEARTASPGERWLPRRFEASGINAIFALDLTDVVPPRRDRES